MSANPRVASTRRIYPIAAGAVILFDDTVALITGGGTSSGYATPGAVSSVLRTIGVAIAFFDAYGNKIKLASPTAHPGDNTNGIDGAIWVEVQGSFGHDGRAAYRRKNGTSSDACTQADVGSRVYLLDNRTMSRVSTSKSLGGELESIDGVTGDLWVVFPLGGY